jgi:uncharacterized protein YaiL (DUF2058 family)
MIVKGRLLFLICKLFQNNNQRKKIFLTETKEKVKKEKVQREKVQKEKVLKIYLRIKILMKKLKIKIKSKYFKHFNENLIVMNKI